MAYGIGHLSSTEGSKCIICGKVTSTFLTVSDYLKNGGKSPNINIRVPVCDEHYSIVSAQKEVLIAHAKAINSFLKNLEINK